MKSSIDIYDYVYVQLTTRGKDILSQYCIKNDFLVFGYQTMASFDDNLSRFTIIDLMKIFWSDIRNVDNDSNLPFVGGNVMFDPLGTNLPINLNNDVFVVLTESGEEAMDDYYSSGIRNGLWDKKRRLCDYHLYKTIAGGMKLMSFFLGDFLQMFGEEVMKGYDQLFDNDAVMLEKPDYDL